MSNEGTIDQRRKDVALEATYQLEALLRMMACAVEGTDETSAIRSLTIRAHQLNGILMSIVDSQVSDVGAMEVDVFGSLQGQPDAGPVTPPPRRQHGGGSSKSAETDVCAPGWPNHLAHHLKGECKLAKNDSNGKSTESQQPVDCESLLLRQAAILDRIQIIAAQA